MSAIAATGELAVGGDTRGVWRVYRTERRKLASQLATRVLALLCVLGPFAFVAILQAQSASPADTLFGVWAHSSGFAVSLVVLGFAAQWGFPVIAGVLAGDIFSSEDRYGTWKMVLTRSCSRVDVFAGKVVAAATFSVVMVALTAISSLLAGVLLVGDQPLVGLGGTLLSTGKSLWLVLMSWLLRAARRLEIVSVLWTVGALTASWLILRRRDFAGTPVARRVGWVMPVRVVIVSVVVIALLAVAASWGPAAVTPARLKASITPVFNNLTLLQQRELGRTVPAGYKLQILSGCNRRSGGNTGSGDDWVCTMNVLVPQQGGALPFQVTPVSYDVSVKSNGCYKADAPPSFVGQQMMRVPHGHSVVNPLITIYGCFNTL